MEICHLIAARGFTSATGGNISVRLDDGTSWVTPSRLHKARVAVSDLVRVDGTGKVVEGQRQPSSEQLVHLAIYRALPQAQAVVHAHPPAATGFAQACRPIDTRCSSEATVILGPEVPVIPYERPSTQALADAVGRAMTPRQKAYLLGQHGAVTWGGDLWEAYDILDTLEIFTQSLVVATIAGGAKPLPEVERQWLEQRFIGKAYS